MKKKNDWTKVYAHRVSKEAGAEREKEHELQLQLLKREPDSPFAYPEMVRISNLFSRYHPFRGY